VGLWKTTVGTTISPETRYEIRKADAGALLTRSDTKEGGQNAVEGLSAGLCLWGH
jgi:hypothetical protein